MTLGMSWQISDFLTWLIDLFNRIIKIIVNHFHPCLLYYWRVEGGLKRGADETYANAPVAYYFLGHFWSCLEADIFFLWCKWFGPMYLLWHVTNMNVLIVLYVFRLPPPITIGTYIGFVIYSLWIFFIIPLIYICHKVYVEL